MNKSILIFLLGMVFFGVRAESFVSGADVSWCTEMEADGRLFYNKAGEETELFELMEQIGMSAVRLRVFVDPENGYGPWCDKADVLAKALRAKARGLDLMIDFHYSDRFADPGTQQVPRSWQNMNREQIKEAVDRHTREILQALKDEGIEPMWVQVGNETNNGMLGDFGRVRWDLSGAARFADYAELSNVGYDAVKAVFPGAKVIIHLAGTESGQWFFPDFKAAGGKFDIIGFSHYPNAGEWNSSAAGATHSNVNTERYVREAIVRFGVPVMICETGFDVKNPRLAHEVMIDLFNRLRPIDGCCGIFYWEPETDGQWRPESYIPLGWGAYNMGAFTTDGRPTKALDAFGGRTVVDPYPSALKIYDRAGSNVLATMLPVADSEGEFMALLDVTEPWMNINIVDPESNTWYGSDPADKTKLSTADNKWGLWIDSEHTGIYTIKADLASMTWSHAYGDNSGVDDIIVDTDAPEEWYDLYGHRIANPTPGNLYIVRKGNQVHKVIL